MDYKSIAWIEPEGMVRMLDQRLLPGAVRYLDYTDARGVAGAIAEMVIRGAPAIGAVAAYGLAVELRRVRGDDAAAWRAWERADKVLRRARPTAVNLSWALERMRARVSAGQGDGAAPLRERALAEAHAIAKEDIAVNRAIGRHGLELLPQGATALHHCNTGGLATVGYGTALGVIRAAHEAGRGVSVLVGETRPRLQGARLTCWELRQLGVPHKLIVDGAAAFYLRRGEAACCLVGCDRVATNGDVANKIGTYSLALAARAHGVPFYVAAPCSSVDLTAACGEEIEIEWREDEEVAVVGGERVAPEGTEVGNPAFDVTPGELVSAFITERGVVWPPFAGALRSALLGFRNG